VRKCNGAALPQPWEGMCVSTHFLGRARRARPGVYASLDRLGVLDQVRTVENYEDVLTLAGAPG